MKDVMPRPFPENRKPSVKAAFSLNAEDSRPYAGPFELISKGEVVLDWQDPEAGTKMHKVVSFPKRTRAGGWMTTNFNNVKFPTPAQFAQGFEAEPGVLYIAGGQASHNIQGVIYADPAKVKQGEKFVIKASHARRLPQKDLKL